MRPASIPGGCSKRSSRITFSSKPASLPDSISTATRSTAHPTSSNLWTTLSETSSRTRLNRSTRLERPAYKFGAAYNGGKFASPTGVRSSGNYLIYGDINQALYREEAGSKRGFDATIGFDWSPGDVN